MAADLRIGSGLAALVKHVEVIRLCLAELGIVSEVRFAARLHRHCFDEICRTSGWTPEASLQHVLDMPELKGFLGAAVSLRRVTVAGRGPWAATTRRKLYVVGGESDGGAALSSVEAFDPRLSSWEPVSPHMPVKRAAAAGGALSGKFLYVCGGAGPFAGTVSRFSLAGQKWEVQESMQARRAQHAAAVLNGRLYVCGGVDGMAEHGGPALSSVERFHHDGGRRGRGAWELLPSMLEPRRGLALAALGGQLHACGGSRGWDLTVHPPVRTSETFDPAVGVWTPAPSMLERRLLPAYAVVGRRLQLCGGVTGDGQEAATSAEHFDPAKGVWEALPPMSVPRYAAAAVSADGKFYVFGGKPFPGFGTGYPDEWRQRSAECYDPINRTWGSLPPMAERRSNPVAISVVS